MNQFDYSCSCRHVIAVQDLFFYSSAAVKFADSKIKHLDNMCCEAKYSTVCHSIEQLP